MALDISFQIAMTAACTHWEVAKGHLRAALAALSCHGGSEDQERNYAEAQARVEDFIKQSEDDFLF